MRKDEAIERIFAVVESHAPGFRQSVIAHSALSPADLEREFGLHHFEWIDPFAALAELEKRRAAA